MSFSISGIMSGGGRLSSIKSSIMPSGGVSSGVGVVGGAYEPFKELGLTLAQYKEHLAKVKSLQSSLAWQDLFRVDLVRLAPKYPIEKSKSLCEFIQSIEITHDSFDTEEVQVGSGYMNTYSGLTSATISITFNEFKGGDVYNFLTTNDSNNSKELGKAPTLSGGANKIEVGTNLVNQLLGTSLPKIGANDGIIIPSDGTYLLPYEYYFNLKLYRVFFDQNTIAEAVVYEGNVILEGNISQSFSVGDSALSTIQANFKPMQSFI